MCDCGYGVGGFWGAWLGEAVCGNASGLALVADVATCLVGLCCCNYVPHW